MCYVEYSVMYKKIANEKECGKLRGVYLPRAKRNKTSKVKNPVCHGTYRNKSAPCRQLLLWVSVGSLEKSDETIDRLYTYIH